MGKWGRNRGKKQTGRYSKGKRGEKSQERGRRDFIQFRAWKLRAKDKEFSLHAMVLHGLQEHGTFGEKKKASTMANYQHSKPLEFLKNSGFLSISPSSFQTQQSQLLSAAPQPGNLVCHLAAAARGWIPAHGTGVGMSWSVASLPDPNHSRKWNEAEWLHEKKNEGFMKPQRKSPPVEDQHTALEKTLPLVPEESLPFKF